MSAGEATDMLFDNRKDVNMNQYHIQRFGPTSFGPTDVWPEGGWSLYQIDCDQIAQRIGFDAKGKVVRRDSWCGYIGCFETLQEVMAAIEASRVPRTIPFNKDAVLAQLIQQKLSKKKRA